MTCRNYRILQSPRAPAKVTQPMTGKKEANPVQAKPRNCSSGAHFKTGMYTVSIISPVLDWSLLPYIKRKWPPTLRIWTRFTVGIVDDSPSVQKFWAISGNEVDHKIFSNANVLDIHYNRIMSIYSHILLGGLFRRENEARFWVLSSQNLIAACDMGMR